MGEILRKSAGGWAVEVMLRQAVRGDKGEPGKRRATGSTYLAGRPLPARTGHRPTARRTAASISPRLAGWPFQITEPTESSRTAVG